MLVADGSPRNRSKRVKFWPISAELTALSPGNSSEPFGRARKQQRASLVVSSG